MRRLLLLACFCSGLSACGGIDFGDNPDKPVVKTDPQLTAPPPELRNGSATEAGARR